MLLIILHMIPDTDDPYGIVGTRSKPCRPAVASCLPTPPAISARRKWRE
jgi:hypothetical protein